MSERLRGSTLGDVVHHERRRLGRGLREVARATGISASHLCDIEHGRRLPSVEVAERLAAELGISDLPMRGFLVEPEVIEWACRTPEVGRLLSTLAHFDASPDHIEALANRFMEIKDG